MPQKGVSHYQGVPRYDDGDKAPASLHGTDRTSGEYTTGDMPLALDAKGNPLSWMMHRDLLEQILLELHKINTQLAMMTGSELEERDTL